MVLAGVFVFLRSAGDAFPQGEMVQVNQDFTADPGWEGVNNRVVCESCPTVTQDFGWSPTSYSGGSGGEIGGTIVQSRTPAWYGLALGRPLSFRDRFSASGSIAIMPMEGTERSGAAYLGFFNSTRQEWRPWNSMAIRIRYLGPDWATFGLDSMTALWNGHGYKTDILMPADGRRHRWRFVYDPDATPPEEWPDPQLKSYLSHRLQTPEDIFAKARQAEPGVTLEQVNGRLRDALALGLVAFLPKKRGVFYTLLDSYENRKGSLTFQLDDGREYRDWLPPALHDGRVSMDRFGIFNRQIYHRVTRFFVSDLTVNGTKVDLRKDPGWDGRGNRVTFVERDFQRQDFGYSETNWAGTGIGEIGGLFYRTEPVDPIHGYYADDVGRLTLDDPITFSGNIAFVNGATDAGMFFGYFNAGKTMAELEDERAGMPLDDMLGLVVDGPTRVGYYFTALCSPKREVVSDKHGPIILPTCEPHTFSFTYDPQANGGVGRITVTLDGKSFFLDLTPQQRSAGATFDRFGVASIRKGGKYVTVYLDDLTYTARRSQHYTPVYHEQQVTRVPYPPGGRKY
jgi:hypothetical protein